MGAEYGYFGKVPRAGDFLFRGLPAHTAEIWAVHMEGWVAAGREAAGSGWTDRFATSPVWRFVLAAGALDERSWTGLLAGSADSVGRAFPFTVMAAAGVDPAATQPVRRLDPCLDPVEEGMLAFIEGGDGRALMAVLKAFAAEAEAVSGEKAPAGNVPPLILPRGADEAVCIRTGPGRLRAYIRPAAHGGDDAPLCIWWHGGGRLPGHFCVTRGIPSGRCAVPFFLGGWEKHGWRRREAGACRAR